jgi:hypothetical protein
LETTHRDNPKYILESLNAVPTIKSHSPRPKSHSPKAQPKVMGNEQSSYYCPGCRSSYTGGGANWKRCTTCYEQGVLNAVYCHNCFSDGWNEEVASCNACKTKHGALIKWGGTGTAIGGGFRPKDVKKIELERETKPDGTVWERMTIYFWGETRTDHLVQQVAQIYTGLEV